MKTTHALLAALALAAAPLAGCSSGEDFCQQAEDVLGEGQRFEDLDPSDRGNYDEMADRFHELAEDAPSEIADDLQYLGDAVAAIATGDPSAAQDLDPAELTEASDTLAEWGEEHC